MTSDFSPISVDLAREPDFSLGGLKVRPSLRQVKSPGGSETLEPRVMQVLVALSQKRGEVVSRDELTQRCWEGRAVGEDALTRCISRLRKLGEVSGDFSVETIPRVGYRLMARADDAQPAAREAEPAGPASNPQPGSKVVRWVSRPLILAALVFVAFAAGLGVWLMSGGRGEVAASATGLRIAVLPFDVQADGPDALALARRAPAAIGDALLKAGYQVVPSSLTQAYTDEKRGEAAEDLKATHIVHGEVAVKNGLLQLTSRITNKDGEAIGAYLLQSQSAAELPEQAGARIAYAFRWLRLDPVLARENAIGQADALRSSDAMSGLTLLSDYEERRRYLETAENPGPMAYLMLLMTASATIDQAPVADRKRMLDEMREARRRAGELGAEASMLGLSDLSLIPEIDWAKREEIFRANVEAPPRMGLISGNYANFLLFAGRNLEAETFARKYVSMEPTSPFGPVYLAGVLLAQGRYEEALKETEVLIQKFPANAAAAQVRFGALLWSGDIEGGQKLVADPRFGELIDPPAPARPAVMSLAALKSRSAADVAALVSACKDAEKLSGTGEHICATTLVELGRIEDAFRLIDQIFPELRGGTPEEIDGKWLAHPNVVPQAKLLMNPVTAPLREDPRIIAVFERIGLVDFWRTTGKWPDFCESEPKSVCARMKRS